MRRGHSGAPGHGAQDAGLLRASGLPATDSASAPQALALNRRHRPDPGGRSRRAKKQGHTAKRIYERLRDESGFDGGYTTVKDYVRENRRQTREMFVPLSHPPGHAQCDFGEAGVVIGGMKRKAHCFVIDLPHSDGCFVKAYPAETTESFLDGHVSAFAYLGGVPQGILYDNTKPIPRWDVHFGEIYDDRKDSTAPHIIFRPQLGGHRWCGLAICTFHLGFGLGWPWSVFWATAGVSVPDTSPSFSLTICSMTGSGAPARAMTKARWRDWWGTGVATFWCRCRPSRALMRSVLFGAALPGANGRPTQGTCGDRRSAYAAGPERPAAAASGSL